MRNLSLHLFFLVLLYLTLNSGFILASVDTGGYYRQQLQQLLMERQQKFSSYSQSLEERSGIFGNKTKKDILRSNEVLINLVKTDNRIIDVLNRVVDFRNYEKVSFTYDKMENQQHLDNLIKATDTLSKQVTALTELNGSLKTKNKKLSWAVYGLLIIPAVVLFLRMWRRQIRRQSNFQ